jgi:hypothetical protein
MIIIPDRLGGHPDMVWIIDLVAVAVRSVHMDSLFIEPFTGMLTFDDDGWQSPVILLNENDWIPEHGDL